MNETFDKDSLTTDDRLLTTKDNPYNPFTEWEKWYDYDEALGYHTCGLIARIAKVNTLMVGKEKDEEILRAMRRIIQIDLTDNYCLVSKESFK